MKRLKILLPAILGSTVFFSSMPAAIRSLAFAPGSQPQTRIEGRQATPDDAEDSDAGEHPEPDGGAQERPATPADAQPGENGTKPEEDAAGEKSEPGGDFRNISSVPKEREKKYTVSRYDFDYSFYPLSLTLGEDSIEDYLPDIETVDVYAYLGNPDGDDFLDSLPVTWDFNGIDFSETGTYTVTGHPDTDACEYPVDWDRAPALSFTLEILRRKTLTFVPEMDGETLVLNYEMDGEPFLLPELSSSLIFYESQDQGQHWHNLTQSVRVQISDSRIAISGISSDSLFQLTRFTLDSEPDEFIFYSNCSDIVSTEPEDGALSVSIIPSGGLRGGKEWKKSEWDSAPIQDGSYQILDYRLGPGQERPLEFPIPLGSTETLEFIKESYQTVYVFYEDGKVWRARILLPVVWDWDAAGNIDCNQIGSTVIRGHFSEETTLREAPFLDFEHMPELTVTVTVYSQRDPFTLSPKQSGLSENNTVRFRFLDRDGGRISFADVSVLTVWCSTDSGLNWYDITDEPNVTLESDTLSVSHLSDHVLRAKGYSIQIGQTIRGDLELFSSYPTVLCNGNGTFFEPGPSGGDRGGGNRQDKPPKGLFDSIMTGEPERPTEAPEGPTEAPEGPTDPSEAPEQPDGQEETEGNGGGNSGDGGNTGSNSNIGGSGNSGGSGNTGGSGNSGNNSSGSNSSGSNGADDNNGADGNNSFDSPPGGIPEDSGSPSQEFPPAAQAPHPDSKTSSSPTEGPAQADAAAGQPAQELQAAAQKPRTSGQEPQASAQAGGPASARGILRVMISVTALLAGVFAGFRMIRRR